MHDVICMSNVQMGIGFLPPLKYAFSLRKVSVSAYFQSLASPILKYFHPSDPCFFSSTTKQTIIFPGYIHITYVIKQCIVIFHSTKSNLFMRYFFLCVNHPCLTQYSSRSLHHISVDYGRTYCRAYCRMAGQLAG